jgi:arsenical pump membrane protein
MLIAHAIVAVLAVALVALRPRSSGAVAALLVLAVADLVSGGHVGPVFAVLVPLVLFLCAALSLAAVVADSGLAERTASRMAELARGSTRLLYAYACGLSVALTAAVSVDGAVVLMVPVLLVLTRRFRAPMRPLFLGVVPVANAASIALPQGNPTNLVVIQRLNLSPATFATRMLVPGLVAAAVCAVAVAMLERHALTRDYPKPTRTRTELSRAERRAAIVLAAAALMAWLAPVVGIAPWWPFTAVVAIGLFGKNGHVAIPWRIAIQVLALLIVIGSVGVSPPVAPLGLPGLLAVAGGLAALAAVANNLPASIWAGALLGGNLGYAASIGLAVGSLATPQGSVATLIAADLAGSCAPPIPIARFTLIAAAAMLAATLLVWVGV